MTPKTSSPKPNTIAHVSQRLEEVVKEIGEMKADQYERDTPKAASIDPAQEASWKARQAQTEAVNSARMTTLSVIMHAIRAEIDSPKVTSTTRVKNLAEAASLLGSNSLY